MRRVIDGSDIDMFGSAGIFGAGVFAGYMLARYRVRFEPREGFEPGARATGERGWQP